MSSNGNGKISRLEKKTFWFELISKNALFYQTKVFQKDFGFHNLPHRTNLNLNIIMMINLLISTLARGKATVSVESQVT